MVGEGLAAMLLGETSAPLGKLALQHVEVLAGRLPPRTGLHSCLLHLMGERKMSIAAKTVVIHSFSS
jgi:hypothetical protein